jgi:hypothetical protein
MRSLNRHRIDTSLEIIENFRVLVPMADSDFPCSYCTSYSKSTGDMDDRAGSSAN